MERFAALLLRQLRPANANAAPDAAPDQPPALRAGVIGLDGPAGVAIAQCLLDRGAGRCGAAALCRVVAAYDRGTYPRPSTVDSSVPHGMHGTIPRQVFACAYAIGSRSRP
eukprot:SAG31_NODE_3987_length_3683_cov_4.328962_7_plen_111_part_00